MNRSQRSALTWRVNLRHCDGSAGGCHTHEVQSFSNACGSFPAPDHTYPSYLELELTARDADGLSATATRRLDPRTARVTLASSPPGARLTLGAETATAPFWRDVIVGSLNTIGAQGSQVIGGDPYAFTAWSDGGERSHNTEVDADTTLTATFTRTFRIAGTDVVGPFDSNVAGPGEAEVYQTAAALESGTATELWLFVNNLSRASDLVLGLYADEGGAATRLLGSGRIKEPQPDAWNKVDVHIPGIQAGRKYWIALLNPLGGTGFLRWHALSGGGGTPEQESASATLGALPTTWAPGRDWDGGPVSAYVVGTRGNAPAAATASLATTVRSTAAAQAADTSCGTSDPPAPPSPSPRGPVGAWGFDETRGKTARDSSGTGNAGRLSGAVRTRGRFGGGLSFDGRSDWVTVADDPSLDLTRAMTLEAWVRPAARGARSVLVKERGNRLCLRPLRAAERPRVHQRRAGAARLVGASLAALVAPGHDLERADHPDVRERPPGVEPRARRPGHGLRRPAADRRQRDLARVLQGRPRRGARLRPGADRERDRARPRHPRHARGEAPATEDVERRQAARRPGAPSTAARAGSTAAAAPLLEPGEDQHEHDPGEDAADDPREPRRRGSPSRPRRGSR